MIAAGPRAQTGYLVQIGSPALWIRSWITLIRLSKERVKISIIIGIGV